MSAKTRHKSSLEARGDLSDLFASAMTHIRGEKRSDRQIGNLRSALQLFHENRLGLVVAGSTDGLPKDLLTILSQPISAVLPRYVDDYFLSYDAELVGELFVLPRRVWRIARTKSAGLCREMLAELGIPFDLDLNKVGWVPPYVGDEAVTAAWNLRSHKLGHWGPNFRARPCCNELGGCETIGEKLQKEAGSRDWLSSFRRGGMTSKLDELGLRTAMFVPATWLAPLRDPEGCSRFGKVEWDGELVTANLRDRLVGQDFASFEALALETRFAVMQKIGNADEVFSIFAKRGLSFKAPDPSDMLAKSIFDLELSVRAANCCRNEGIETVGQLAAKSEAELLRTPHFGRKTLNELRECVLAPLGLSFRPSTL